MKVSQLLFAFLSFSILTVGSVCASDEDEEIIDCEGEAATTQFCIDKEEAFELRARIEVIYPTLEELTSPPWNEEEYLAAESSYQDGVDLYQDEYYGDAVAKFKVALETFTLLEESFKSTVADKRENVNKLLDASSYEAAVAELDLLVEWYPEDEELLQLHTQASFGHSLKAIVEELQGYISTGSFREAEEVLDQFPEEYYQQEIMQVRGAIETHRQETAFNTTMTTVHKHITDENWDLARQNLETALRIRPNSEVATDLLKEVRESHRLFRIDVFTAELTDTVDSEDWEYALTVIERIEDLDIKDEIDFVDLKTELAELLALDAKLLDYESKDFNAMDESTRKDITSLLDETDHLTEYVRIQTKRQALSDRFEQYTTPVEVTILSDNTTKVRIRPGKEIGSFRSKKLEILPGTYEVIGTRRGFKQVIEQLTILPGSDPMEIKVECSDRF